MKRSLLKCKARNEEEVQRSLLETARMDITQELTSPQKPVESHSNAYS